VLAHYGYQDASGDFFITIDTHCCNGCGDCASACPAKLFSRVDEDPHDPLRREPVVVIAEDRRNKLKYECSSCKTPSEKPPLPCVAACKTGAIKHSW